MDAHVEWRQPLGHDPFEVGLGEAGQRREVAVQEAQPVVVVLEVETPAHPLGQLVDEAELAVVVTRADPVEHRALHLHAERLAVALRDVDDELHPAAPDVELELGLVGQQLPLDDVARDLAVEARDLVAGCEPGQRGG